MMDSAGSGSLHTLSFPLPHGVRIVFTVILSSTYSHTYPIPS